MSVVEKPDVAAVSSIVPRNAWMLFLEALAESAAHRGEGDAIAMVHDVTSDDRLGVLGVVHDAVL